MNASIAALAYLVSGVLFILSLRGLSSPETSRQGNTFGMVGMALAVGVTLLTLWSTGALDWTDAGPDRGRGDRRRRGGGPDRQAGWP